MFDDMTWEDFVAWVKQPSCKDTMTQEEILNKYSILTKELQDLIAQDEGESYQADVLRDQMDPLWYSMDEETLEKAKKL